MVGGALFELQPSPTTECSRWTRADPSKLPRKPGSKGCGTGLGVRPQNQPPNLELEIGGFVLALFQLGFRFGGWWVVGGGWWSDGGAAVVVVGGAWWVMGGGPVVGGGWW